MRKCYLAPQVDFLNLSTADMITLSLFDLLGVEDWDKDGIDVSTLEFTEQS